MKRSYTRIVLLLIAGLAALTLQPASAWAGASVVVEEPVSDEIARILEAELTARPGGTVVGNEIRYDDGVTFVAVEVDVFSLSQCASGKFCGWAQSNYSGSFYSTSGSGVTKSLSWTARSYANKRTTAARLYNSTGAASACFTPGQGRPTIGTSYYSPSKVYLSGATGC